MLRARQFTAIPALLVAALLFALGTSAAAQPKPVDLTGLRAAVDSADKRGHNVYGIREALDALEKALPGIKGGAVPAELRALREAVDTAIRKGENVDAVAEQLAAVERAVAGKPPAKPEPRAERSPLYYPTGTGAAWVYDRPGGSGTGDVPQFTVIAVKTNSDAAVVSIRNDVYYYGKGVYAQVIASPEGLRQVEGRHHTEGWILKTGLPSGSTWTGPDKIERTVLGPEEVKTRAGKFQALRVTWYEGAELHSRWYAPNVGEVKYVISYKGKVTYEYELWRFTPPDKK